MPNLVAVSLMVSDKKIFEVFIFFFSFVTMATTVFDGIKFFKKFLKRTIAGRFL